MTGAAGPPHHARSAADFVFRRSVVPTISNQACLGRRAAHVKRQQVLAPGLPGDECGRDNASGRTRLNRHGRDGNGFVRFENAAIRSHQVERRQLAAARNLFQSRQVGGKNWPDIGANRGRARALELSKLGQYIR